MSSQQEKFARLKIISPCNAAWDEMVGDQRKRECAACNKPVFDFSHMTPRQVDALVAAMKGNLCARLTRDETGALVTLPPASASEVSPAYQRRSGAPFAKAMVSALLSLSVPTVATLPVLAPLVAVARADNSGEVAMTGEATATLSGIVTDQSGAVIPNASLTLTSQATLLERTARTTEEGRYSFDGLMPGSYSLMVQASGFTKMLHEGITLNASQTQEMATVLAVSQVSAMGGAIAIQPKTLRELYQESELIGAALVGQSTLVEKDEDTRLVKTALHFSAVMKGEPRQNIVYVYHSIYGDEEDTTYERGKSLLAFLQRRRDDEGLKLRDGYEATDYQSIKPLTPDEIQTYRQRIDDLKALEQNGQPDQFALVEWLVRCAEEPATRWDGAYELRASERPAAKDAVSMLSLLNDGQKNRLVSALVNTPQFSLGDQLLLQLAAQWKDPRLVPFLLTHLTLMMNEAPPEAETLMDVLADVLDDKELKKMAGEYSEVVRYLDDQPAEDEPSETLAADATDDATADATAEPVETAAEESQALVTTKAERALWIRKFLTLVANKRSY